MPGETEGPRDWQSEADRLAHETADPTAWFERLYAAGAAGAVTMPWDHADPHWLLADWTRGRTVRPGERALVVGCGLGGDAEHLARLGFVTSAFDISATAVETARSRHPETDADYHVADLFDLPADWWRGFDLVVEIYTVQALPVALRERATASIRDLVAPGGRLLVVQAAHVEGDDGPPWPLTRAQIEAFGADGLEPVAIESLGDPDGYPFWRAELTRPI